MATHRAVIGSDTSFWLWDDHAGFDLTHPATPTSPLLYPRVPIQATTSKITVSPAKTALVIIDMQNFFLSEFMGRPADSKGIKAARSVLECAIPAARKAGIRVVWLNWGLTQQDIDKMPPATLRAFGFAVVPVESREDEKFHQEGGGEDKTPELLVKGASRVPQGKDPKMYKGLGSEIGEVTVEDGSKVDAGRLLMRDTWNAALWPPMEKARQEGMREGIERKDVWIHKNRMSGFWGPNTPGTEFLEKEGITTLIFAGVNTDQCVLGSLQDAMTRGWDCLMLNDGCATTSPTHAQECVEYNVGRSWGFAFNCKDFAEGVERMETNA